jgi:hypothetical protein
MNHNLEIGDGTRVLWRDDHHSARIHEQDRPAHRRGAQIISKALIVRRPRTRYLVGRDAIFAAAMAKFAPDRMMDRLLHSLIKS